MTINEKINKRLEPYGLTVEDLTEEELADAKRSLSPNLIDGFFSSYVVIRKALMKGIERMKNNS